MGFTLLQLLLLLFFSNLVVDSLQILGLRGRICNKFYKGNRIPIVYNRNLLFRISASTAGKDNTKPSWYCTNCGADHIKWVGQCSSCLEWNAVKEFKFPKASGVRKDFGRKESLPQDMITPLSKVPVKQSDDRLPIFSQEIERLLGGGIVPGSVILIAGEPGIGKSTLLLQLGCSISSQGSDDNRSGAAMYISGEETAGQIASRAYRLGLNTANINLICDTRLDNALDLIETLPSSPKILLVDSIQTMSLDSSINSFSVGSVSQLKDTTARLVRFAKESGIPVIMLGHVTKSGDVGGPKMLEHMVDVVLAFEEREENSKLIRASKNRFGPTADIALIEMKSEGLVDVINPSTSLVTQTVLEEDTEGSAIGAVMAGTRPLLAEIQCLASRTSFGMDGFKMSPKRNVEGFSFQRLALLCNVIEKRLGISLSSQDLFINVVGGLRLLDTSCDLAVSIAILSSVSGCKVKKGWALVGEVGLRGELRLGKKQHDKLITEARKLGFYGVIIPKGLDKPNQKTNDTCEDFQVARCSTLIEAIDKVIVGGVEQIKTAALYKRRPRQEFQRGGEEKFVE